MNYDLSLMHTRSFFFLFLFAVFFCYFAVYQIDLLCWKQSTKAQSKLDGPLEFIPDA